MNKMIIAGVDEAGRGPLAGNVYAAAVILDESKFIDGLTDSKRLSAKKRDELYNVIIRDSLAYAIAHATVDEVDELNILQATLLAMRRAILSLKLTPELVLVDGNRTPNILPIKAKAIIKGDTLIKAISAASILAKVSRDREMILLDKTYPQYGFAKHKGYGTAIHIEAIKNHGVLTIHRKTFAPVKFMNINKITN